MYDIVIIGGGLVGATAAYHAATLGATVALIDRNDGGQATAAGAGILTPGTTRNAADAWWRDFAFPAVSYYPELLEQLALDGETDTGYFRCGLLHVATTNDEAQEQKRLLQIIAENKSLGAPAVDEVAQLSREEAKAFFPPLGELRAAVHVSGACRVDGRLLLASLRRAAARRKVDLIRDSAASLLHEGGTVCGIELSGGEPLAARTVVVAGGAWSGALATSLGLNLPISPQRGQIVHLQLPDTETSHWPVIMGFHSHYMVSFQSGRVVVGATRELDTRFDVRATAGGIYEVLGEALRIAPGLNTATLAEVRVGLRPTTPDGLPMLGSVPALEGAFIAAGHGPSGLQLGPYSGKLVAELALDQPISTNISPFRPERFC